MARLPPSPSSVSSVAEAPERITSTNTDLSTASASTVASSKHVKQTSTGLTLGDRTRTQSISYAAPGEASRKGSVVDADCPMCQNDRIHGPQDVFAAIKLTWSKNRTHLLITWLHVPVGVVLMLVVVWAIKIGIDKTPLRFPAAVISMIVFLILLLSLDFLSVKFPGRDAKSEDPEAAEKGEPTATPSRQRKRFLDPFMAALAPPADFLLRNMSVMFTPSFIMIPAREVIPGREIGILAGYFFLTQVLGYVLPVFLCRFVDWIFSMGPRRARAKEAEKQFEHLRRNSLAGSGLGFGHSIEKSLADAGRVKNAPIVAGLFATSLVAFAPLRPVQPILSQVPEDEIAHYRHVAIELARQQGEGPAVAQMSRGNSFLSGTPKSDVSTFQHPARRHSHMKRTRSEGSRILSAQRSAVLGVHVAKPVILDGSSTAEDPLVQTPPETEEMVSAFPPNQTLAQVRSMSSPPSSYSPAAPAEAYQFPPRSPQPSAMSEVRRPSIIEEGRGQYMYYSSPDVPQIQTIMPAAPAPAAPAPSARIAFDPILETAASVRAGGADEASRRNSIFTPSAPGTRRNSLTIIPSHTSSKLNLKAESSPTASGGIDEEGKNDDNDDGEKTPTPSIRCRHNSVAESTMSCGPDAVERLSDWFGDLITPAIYALLVIIGLPLYFVLNFSLPLFLGLNLLIFIGAITVVPPKIRRFAHPILTTSVLTVLVIWALAAMKGNGLKETLLGSYQVGEKYYDIWKIGGYSGPVPGAGDFLISTLDAGIVALAVPCYRYRAELRESFFKLLCVLVPCAALSLFAWPGFAHLITLDRSRSLAFAARFMSTPLAIELNSTLGGDENIVVILVVITGIVAAILKEPFFKLMRVSMDDHFIVGATFGATSGAIGASSLIARPKVMAVASLSFVIFGALLLICAAVPPLVTVVRQVAGF
ncbi:unnamed protein product [Tilletia caries]|nr:hypothetical protein CF336_g656 [Tilletia laevis]KAE8208327.1 hypothetical protein CF335_g493 [Tilletia laevis]CAD6886215.1 unnamed protein product [Tilletia caries]